MAKIELDMSAGNPDVELSLKGWLLKKAQGWINGLLNAEMEEHLGRKCHEPAGSADPNYRNGYRPRLLNILGLGTLSLRVPRDRQGSFKSLLLPERRGQAPEMKAFLTECFLAGLSTRDMARISEKHLGKRYDSKQVSRIVARASEELDQWQNRSLEGRTYKFLFVDGANFKVRINHRVSKQSFCAVLGISEVDEVIEVLAVAMGDKEKADLWGDIFTGIAVASPPVIRFESSSNRWYTTDGAQHRPTWNINDNPALTS
ncbi:MAG: transposase [Verrucomicrobia bacterium]|nr:transposase [Verrucomicrobiota bacterium]